jgi:tRNA pseudouridine32 synthase/23S rRNA pseudouridine746 synthase
MVHRLDMSTSGVMVIALNIKSYRNLQKQFLRKTIKKLYVAVLERDISNEVALEGKLIYRLGWIWMISSTNGML